MLVPGFWFELAPERWLLAMGVFTNAAEWYNKKHFMLIHKQQNGDELYSPELVNRLVGGVEFLLPFYDYFAALGSEAAL